MAKGKLILICRCGGEFVTNEDGSMTYNNGEANAANVTSETPFNELKLNLAETCNFDQETVSVKYFLPGNKRNLITVKNDKDVKRMVDFHGEAITAEVFVTGTTGFVPKTLDVETNRQTEAKNDETINNDIESSKKDEKVKRQKVGPKKDKKMKKDDEVAKSPVTSPTRRTRRAVAAEKEKEKEKEKTVLNDANKSDDSTSDSSSSAASERVNTNVDSNCSSDYAPSRYTKRKKGSSEEVTAVNASPADSVKKRRRTPSWKLGANGRPTIVSDSGNKKSERKSVRLAAKEEKTSEKTKTGRKRGRPRGTTNDQDHDQTLVGTTNLATCDDDVSVEDLVSIWKSAITGVGQQFKNVHEFQETLQKYAIANDFEFKFKKNDAKRAVGECVSEGCSWKFNATWVPSTKSFNIKTMNNVHTCDTELKNRLLNSINEKLQESPHLKPNEIANQLLKDFGGDSISNPKKEFQEPGNSREQLHGSDKESYNKLPWFCEKIIETNQGSISKLVIGENKRFKALFVSFYASLYGFQNGCRPLLFLEATSLRSKFGEFLLTANAIDGNDGFFTVAFAVVDVADGKNWRWFLEQLKGAILTTQSITFVFDRETDLKSSVLEVFQDSYIGYTIYHLLESFKRVVKGPFHGDGKSFLPIHFLAAAHAVRLGGFRKSTEQIKQISSQAYDWVMQIEPQYYTSSSFKGERYNYIIDDVSGPITKLMEDYRDLPILHKIDAIIRTMIDTLSDAKLDACMWSTHLTPVKEKELQDENFNSCGLKVLISSDTLFEVREDSTHVVNISNWSCTCLGWKETGLPCRHALAVFALIGKNPYEFCSNYFTVDAYRLTYIESINLVPIEKGVGEKMDVERGENEEFLKVGGENEESLKVGGVNEEGLKVGGENEMTWVENDETLNVGGGNEEGLKVGGENEMSWVENEEILKIGVGNEEGSKVGSENEMTWVENEETLNVGGENKEALKVGVENEITWVENEETLKIGGGNEEGLKVGGENEEALEVRVGNEEGGENMEVEIVWGENEEALKVGGENEEALKVGGENEEALKVGGGNQEDGEKIEVVEEDGEKIEVVEENGEKIEGEKEKSEIVEIEDEKTEKIEIEKTGDEKEEALEKVEGGKEEVLKDEGEKGKISEEEEDDDSNVFVLPPIPIKPADEIKENMEWEETEVETKRTVTCTKCKQPGHNKKSCNFYQTQQLTLVNDP